MSMEQPVGCQHRRPDNTREERVDMSVVRPDEVPPHAPEAIAPRRAEDDRNAPAEGPSRPGFVAGPRREPAREGTSSVVMFQTRAPGVHRIWGEAPTAQSGKGQLV